jgi:large subunit ribosomal protein L25
MAKKHTLKAETRARTGSGLLKQMRREGLLPCVMYGKNAENKNLKVSAKAFYEMMGESESENILVDLDVKGEGSSLAFLQDVQHDPMSGEPLHADFLAVDSKTELTASVPVHLIGEPIGVKGGGILDQMMHTLDVRCSVASLPELLEFDVSHLDEGDSITIGEVTLPAGVVAVLNGDVAIANVGKPAAAISEEAAEGAAAVPVVAEEESAEPAEA